MDFQSIRAGIDCSTLINAMGLDHAGVDAEDDEQYQADRQADAPAQGFDGAIAFALVHHHEIQPGAQIV